MPIGLDSLEGIARRLLTCLRAPLSSDYELVCDRFPLVPRFTLLPGRERTSEAGRG